MEKFQDKLGKDRILAGNKVEMEKLFLKLRKNSKPNNEKFEKQARHKT